MLDPPTPLVGIAYSVPASVLEEKVEPQGMKLPFLMPGIWPVSQLGLYFGFSSLLNAGQQSHLLVTRIT